MELIFTPCKTCEERQMQNWDGYLCSGCVSNRYQIRKANAALKQLEKAVENKSVLHPSFEKAFQEGAKHIRKQIEKATLDLANITKSKLQSTNTNLLKKKAQITATKIFTFDSAHYLQGHPGKCQNVHGHRWTLEVTFQKDPEHQVDEYNPPDMVMDFSEIKKLINTIIIDKLDHQLINEVPEYRKLHLRPTAENMVEVFAKWIMAYDKGWYKNNLVALKLWETPTSFVTWIKE